MALDRFTRIRRSRVFRFILGGSALGFAVGGTAAAANNVMSQEEAESKTVSLDLEDGQVAVAVGEDPADALDDADAGLADESPTPATPATPPTPDTPPSPQTPPTPDTPPTPPSPESPDTPDQQEEDDQGEDSPDGDDD